MYLAQSIPLGLSLGEASAALLAVFTIGAVANAGRAMLMRLAGQRIVARLRERTYAAAIRQEVEFVERGEGDVISRLSVDSSIVGERYVGISLAPQWLIECPCTVSHRTSPTGCVPL